MKKLEGGDFKKTIERLEIESELAYYNYLEKIKEDYLELNIKLKKLSRAKKSFVKVYNIFLDNKQEELFSVVKNNSLEEDIFNVYNYLRDNLQSFEENSKEEEITESIRFLFHKLNFTDKELKNKNYEDFKKGWDILPNIGKKFFSLLNKQKEKLQKNILKIEKELQKLKELGMDFYYRELLLETPEKIFEVLDNKKIFKILDKYLVILKNNKNKIFSDVLEENGFEKEEIFSDIDFVGDFFEKNIEKNIEKIEKKNINIFMVQNFFYYLSFNINDKTFKDFLDAYGYIDEKDFIKTKNLLEKLFLD